MTREYDWRDRLGWTDDNYQLLRCLFPILASLGLLLSISQLARLFWLLCFGSLDFVSCCMHDVSSFLVESRHKSFDVLLPAHCIQT